MAKQFYKTGLVTVLLTALISGCVNLKHVYNFSSSSLVAVTKFEDIDYSFKQSCLDKCREKKIYELNINTNDCDCRANDKADSITLLIYSAVKGYFIGLTSLSHNELTNYKTDALNNALTEGDFGSLKIDKTHVEAYSNISKILLKAFTDNYRQRKIKTYIKGADKSISVLIRFLDFNLSENLIGKLNVKKERIKSYYFDLTQDTSLTTNAKRKYVEEYYSIMQAIETKQMELLTYSKALKQIAEGHQKMVESSDKLNTKDIKEQLTQYAGNIKDIESEFNKVKK